MGAKALVFLCEWEYLVDKTEKNKQSKKEDVVPKYGPAGDEKFLGTGVVPPRLDNTKDPEAAPSEAVEQRAELSETEQQAAKLADIFLKSCFPDGEITPRSIAKIEALRAFTYDIIGSPDKETREREPAPPGAVQDGEEYPDCHAALLDPKTGGIMVVRGGRSGRLLVDQYNIRTGQRSRPPIYASTQFTNERGTRTIIIDTDTAPYRHDVPHTSTIRVNEEADEVVVTAPRRAGVQFNGVVARYCVEYGDFRNALYERGLPPAIFHDIDPVSVGQLAWRAAQSNQLLEVDKGPSAQESEPPSDGWEQAVLFELQEVA